VNQTIVVDMQHVSVGVSGCVRNVIRFYIGERIMPTKGQTTSVLDRLWARTEVKDGHFIWLGKTVGRGYGSIWYQGRNVRINRLICHLYYGMDLDDKFMQGNHKSSCPYYNCWNPNCLYVGTQMDNVKDQIKEGTFHYGTANLRNGNAFNGIKEE